MLMDCGHNADTGVLVCGFGTKCLPCESGRPIRLDRRDTNPERLSGMEAAYRLLSRRLPPDWSAEKLRRLAWCIVLMFGKCGGIKPPADLEEVSCDTKPEIGSGMKARPPLSNGSQVTGTP